MKNRIFQKLFVVALLGIGLPSLSLATSPETVDTDKLALAIVKNWQVIHSLHYKLLRKSKQYNDYYVNMEWSQTSDFYRISKHQICKKSSENMAFEEAYNGKLHTEAYYETAILEISSKIPPTHRVLWNESESSLVSPYGFAYAPTMNQQGILQPFKILQKEDSLRDLFRKQAAPTTATIDSHTYVVMEFPGGKDPDGYPYQFNYRVYFDPTNNFFPMRYERVAEGIDYIYLDYQVAELATIKADSQSFLYAKKWEINCYKIKPDEKEKETGKVAGVTMLHEITDLRVNSLEDGDLEMDPAAFRYIHDVDHHRTIVIPR